ncbi:MAG: type II secretion system protein GspG [Candidatus Magasanikbacteria bacterium]|nr:type II secretion system protein GspG [Candidatus Magasanikbacteria bacterium]
MKKRQGFTLIELLVVIAIIALLSTLAVVALGSARKKANDAKRLSDIKQMQTALELYYTDNNEYPTTTASGVTLGSASTACLNTSGFATANCADPFMGQVPSDPGNNAYTYTSTDGTTFSITATLEAGTANLNAGTVVASPSGVKNQ